MTSFVWAAAVVLAWVVARNVGRVRRLDRLHRRLDATRLGLAAALELRRDVAERVAARSAERGAGLAGAVVAARGAGPDREPAENALGRALAAVDRTGLPAGLREALAEAEMSLVVARRLHNDAVRDTLALRSRRLVRWLHLAGTAPLPAYFEIADPPAVSGLALAASRESAAGPPR